MRQTTRETQERATSEQFCNASTGNRPRSASHDSLPFCTDPCALVCPLSLEIFQDPVIAADGHSYERREIEAWLARGKTTSPKTNAELPHAFLVPNRHLKAMCQQFLDEVREVEEAGG